LAYQLHGLIFFAQKEILFVYNFSNIVVSSFFPLPIFNSIHPSIHPSWFIVYSSMFGEEDEEASSFLHSNEEVS
jgi:hypothetical protein